MTGRRWALALDGGKAGSGGAMMVVTVAPDAAWRATLLFPQDSFVSDLSGGAAVIGGGIPRGTVRGERPGAWFWCRIGPGTGVWPAGLSKCSPLAEGVALTDSKAPETTSVSRRYPGGIATVRFFRSTTAPGS
ncbi:hypothetical protein KUV49_15180 [Roseovarius atlanticus]|nr:hypothetical protein [Roseovarius atlanticus]MBY5989283.1 hypothetical protein [Roseovarius atlanticus]